MPGQQAWAQMMVARIQAWRDYRQQLIDDGAHPSEVTKLGRLIAAMVSAQDYDDVLPELKAWHGIGVE